MAEVVQVVHVVVCLTLKRYLPIGVTPERQFDEPFDDVPDVEPDEARLDELRRVDALMVDGLPGDDCILAAQHDAEDVHRREFAKRQQTVPNDNHVCKFR